MTAEVFAIPGTQCDQRLWQALEHHLPDVRLKHLPVPAGKGIKPLVNALLQQLPDRPVPLLGFSMGGYLAAALACQAPLRVARLMVCANTPCALPDEELKQREQLLRWIKTRGYQGMSDRKARAMLAAGNRHNAELIALIKAMDASLGEASLVQQLTATSEREDLFEALSGLSLAVQFCAGSEDALVDRDWLARWQQVGKSRCHWLLGVGHMLPLEAPAALARLISRWLAE